ncbi:MAG: hypothetical protein ABIP06_07560 [Pyrinomonadaceae bacterium]
MKRFIISVLCISVFFIGLGGLVEKTSANFKSDARALELIRLARVAVGGEANINNVRSMTISGTTTHTFKTDSTTDIKQGNLEINFELPGKFSKMIRIGNPGDGENADIRKDVNVIVMKKDDGTTEVKDLGDGRKVIIVKDGDGKVLTENIKPVEGERRIIVKKADGTVLTENIEGGDSATWTTEDSKKIVVDKDVRVIGAGENGGAMRQNEMLRTTLALLLTAPEGTDVSYTFAGETVIDGATCNIVEANTNGSAYKLFLDKITNLPRMISYSGAPMHIIKFDKTALPDGLGQKDVKVFVRKMDAPEALVERQVKFSDFRSVGGLLLPYKWTETVAGNTGETVDITNYEINPANIADKFQNEKVLIRTQKPQ